jgi:hypothetical protein
VANILAEIALDALSKFLHPFDILLGDTPSAIFGVGRARFELRNMLFYLVIPRDVSDQVFYVGKRLHWFNGNRRIEWERVQPRHAHQFRLSIYFSRARTALSRLAVPAHSQVTGLFRLNLMDDVEHYHARRNFSGVIAELSLAFLSSPDAKRGGRHYFISSMIS